MNGDNGTNTIPATLFAAASDTNAWREISSGDLGAATELWVATDLILKGFDVFRNVSPHGPSDLIALKDDQMFRVQVKRSNGMPTRNQMNRNTVWAVCTNAVIRYRTSKEKGARQFT